MSFKIGRQYICDRCGCAEFVGLGSGNVRGLPEGYEDLGGGEADLYPQNWRKTYGMDLCYNCGKEFDKFMRYYATAAH